MKDQLIVVDCQNDFISGSLACLNSVNAVDQIIEYISNNDVKVYYSLDWHSDKNRSFAENGGIWAPHCVKETLGAQLHEDFYRKILKEENKPNKENMFYKGQNDSIEEYSVYNAKNSGGESLAQGIKEKIIICGIASEFCVRESVIEFLNHKKEVYILSKGLGYVDKNEHEKNLIELENLGAKIL